MQRARLGAGCVSESGPIASSFFTRRVRLSAIFAPPSMQFFRGKMRQSDFTKIPNRLSSMGLDSFELATYVAIAMHGGSNARGIFPSWKTLQRITGGQSKERLWKSMNRLRDLGMLEWDRGKTGVANTYYLTKTGTWKRQGGSPGEPVVVRQTNRGGSSNEPPVVRQAKPNQMQLNQMQEPEFANAPMPKAEAVKRFDEIFGVLGGRKAQHETLG